MFNINPLLSLSLICTTILWSEEQAGLPLHEELDRISIKDECGIIGAKNGPARPSRDEEAWVVSLTPFCWQSSIDEVDYVNIQQDFPNMPIEVDQTTPSLPFSWDFGVKAGIGYDFGFDNWDLYFESTYFKNKAHKTVSTSAPHGLVPVDETVLELTAPTQYFATIGFLAELGTHVSAKAKVFLNEYHLDLGRSFFISKHFSLNPFLGLQATWLKNSFSWDLTGGDYVFNPDALSQIVISGLENQTLSSIKKSSFLGGGIRFGTNMNLQLYKKFNLYGSLSSALLNGYFKRSINSTYSGFPDNLFKVTSRFHRFVPVLYYELGLSYDWLLPRDRGNLHLSFGYESSYFLNALYLKTGRIASSLGIQGVNLNIRWDF